MALKSIGQSWSGYYLPANGTKELMGIVSGERGFGIDTKPPGLTKTSRSCISPGYFSRTVHPIGITGEDMDARLAIQSNSR